VNHRKQTLKTPKDLAPETSEGGISCPCIKVCISTTSYEKFSKDLAYICCPSYHPKMSPLGKGIHLGYFICIKTQRMEAFRHLCSLLNKMPCQKS